VRASSSACSVVLTVRVIDWMLTPVGRPWTAGVTRLAILRVYSGDCAFATFAETSRVCC